VLDVWDKSISAKGGSDVGCPLHSKNAVLQHHQQSEGKAIIGIARACTGTVGFYRLIAGNE
jgi:hypothetical protein